MSMARQWTTDPRYQVYGEGWGEPPREAPKPGDTVRLDKGKLVKVVETIGGIPATGCWRDICLPLDDHRRLKGHMNPDTWVLRAPEWERERAENVLQWRQILRSPITEYSATPRTFSTRLL